MAGKGEVESMAVVIRLHRMGSVKRPHYKIVVTDKRHKRDGRFVEILGYYDPKPKDFVFKINRDRMKMWIDRGAKPSPTVRSLCKRTGN